MPLLLQLTLLMLDWLVVRLFHWGLIRLVIIVGQWRVILHSCLIRIHRRLMSTVFCVLKGLVHLENGTVLIGFKIYNFNYYSYLNA